MRWQYVAYTPLLHPCPPHIARPPPPPHTHISEPQKLEAMSMCKSWKNDAKGTALSE